MAATATVRFPALLSDLSLFLTLLRASCSCFTAVILLCNFALHHGLCFKAASAHLRRVQRRLKGALVRDDEGIAELTPGEPVGQLS